MDLLHTILPKVKVKADTERGFRTINESEFDPEVDELYDEPEAAPIAPSEPPPAPRIRKLDDGTVLTEDDVAKMNRKVAGELLTKFEVEFPEDMKVGDRRALIVEKVLTETA